MQKYIDQLVEDLTEQVLNPPPPPHFERPNGYKEEDGLDEVFEWEQAKNIEPIELFGVEKIAFPPAEKLTDSQALQLVDAIEMLWESRNISPFYPDELPVKLKYTLLVGKWDEEWLFCPSMHSTIEFCDYNPEVCPFGEAYCTCKDLDFGEEPDDLMGDEDFEIPY